MSAGNGVYWATTSRAEPGTMTESTAFWRAVLLGIPVISIPLVSALARLVRGLDATPTIPGYWIYCGVVWAYALAVLAGPAEASFGFEPAYLLLLPVGALLNFFDVALTRRLPDSAGGDGRHGGGVTPLALLPVLIAPLAEELLFRSAIRTVFGDLGAVQFVLLSSAVFGVQHVTNGLREAGLKFGNGVLYGTVFVLTGSVVPPFLAHLGYNLVYVLGVLGLVSAGES
jgi:membrane protease YdiL (CAAX protease family)